MPLKDANDPPSMQLVTGLAKIGMVLRSRAWKRAGADRLTPTQAQVIAVLRREAGGLRLSDVAARLGVTPATASDAVSSLVEKGFLKRRSAPEDGRAVALVLTPSGRKQADRIAEWPDFLTNAVDTLSPNEQAAFLRALVKMIRALQEAGDIPIQRMCVTCRFFRPNAHADPANPHHCAFVDAPFGDRGLRLDCGDHEPAPAADLAALWKTFTRPAPAEETFP